MFLKVAAHAGQDSAHIKNNQPAGNSEADHVVGHYRLILAVIQAKTPPKQSILRPSGKGFRGKYDYSAPEPVFFALTENYDIV